jgi:hypothetical protein
MRYPPSPVIAGHRGIHHQQSISSTFRYDFIIIATHYIVAAIYYKSCTKLGRTAK